MRNGKDGFPAFAQYINVHIGNYKIFTYWEFEPGNYEKQRIMTEMEIYDYATRDTCQ